MSENVNGLEPLRKSNRKFWFFLTGLFIYLGLLAISITGKSWEGGYYAVIANNYLVKAGFPKPSVNGRSGGCNPFILEPYFVDCAFLDIDEEVLKQGYLDGVLQIVSDPCPHITPKTDKESQEAWDYFECSGQKRKSIKVFIHVTRRTVISDGNTRRVIRQPIFKIVKPA